MITLVKVPSDNVMYHFERFILLGLHSGRTYTILEHSLYWFVVSPIQGTACRYEEEKLLTKELKHELNPEKGELSKAIKVKVTATNAK